MKEFTSCIGIDISKDTFHVCCKQSVGEQFVIKGTHSFENSYTGFIALLDWTLTKTKNVETLYVMEATGIYHEELRPSGYVY